MHTVRCIANESVILRAFDPYKLRQHVRFAGARTPRSTATSQPRENSARERSRVFYLSVLSRVVYLLTLRSSCAQSAPDSVAPRLASSPGLRDHRRKVTPYVTSRRNCGDPWQANSIFETRGDTKDESSYSVWIRLPDYVAMKPARACFASSRHAYTRLYEIERMQSSLDVDIIGYR